MPATFPIRISPNHRYFIDASGQPFFWLGDTAWPLFTTYPQAAAEKYLSNRAAKGFSVIQGVLAWGDPNPEVSLEGTAPGQNCHGEVPWHVTPAEPNPAFFEYVEYLLQYAEKLGLVLAMVPTWGYNVNNARIFDEKNAFAYGEWLGKRFKGQPNLIWMNGGDREPIGFESIWRAISLGLRAGDGGAHLITYHPCGIHSSSYYFHNEDWLDFNMIQTWTDWPLLYPAVLSDRLLDPAKPVVLAEGAYENGPEYPLGPITPALVRRQAWWAFMAGGSFTYGQNQMWRMEPGWIDSLDTPGADQMTIFENLLQTRPWWQMIPDQGIFASGVCSDRTLNAAVRTLDRTCALLYLSSPCHVLVQLDRIAARTARATWVNPQTGASMDAGLFDTGNLVEGIIFPQAKRQWFNVPGFWEDALLILDAIE